MIVRKTEKKEKTLEDSGIACGCTFRYSVSLFFFGIGLHAMHALHLYYALSDDLYSLLTV